MKHVLFVLAWIFFSCQVSSQLFTFSGSVATGEGLPLAGANIWFDNTYIGAVSNLKGDFKIKNIPAGKYSVNISFLGYETFRKEITLDKDLHFICQLKESIVMGEEVVITAIRAGQKDPIAFTNISGEEIARKNSGKDIPYLLSLTPSLVSSSEAGNGIGYSGFRIRGTDANRINITVNGVPLNDSESHGVWWINMPDLASSVRNMQIQRGVGTSSNGAAAFGASVNIQTLAMNAEPYAEISGSVGSYNTGKRTICLGTGLVQNKFTLDMRLSSIHSDGYIDRATSDLNSYHISAGWHTSKSRLKIITFSGNEKTYQAWDGVSSTILDSARTYNGLGKYIDVNGQEKFYDNQTDNYKQEHYQIHFSKDISRNLIMNTALHYTRGAGYYEQYKEKVKFSNYELPPLIIGDETITRTDLIRRKWLDNNFYGTVFSVIWKPGKIDGILGGGWNIYYGDHFGDIIWARYAGNTENKYRWYENKGEKRDFNLYSKIIFKLTDRLRLYSDIQMRGIYYQIKGIDDDLRDISQNHEFLFFNPKFGWNYDIDNNQRLFFSFSVANREPNRSNFTDAKPGTPAPLHETLYDYEAGYGFRTRNWSTDINYYYMNYHNQLILTGEINDVGAPIMTNARSSYRTGIEFTNVVNLHPRLKWSSNLTVSQNKIRDLDIYVDNWSYWDDPDNEPFQYVANEGTTTIGFSPSVTGASFLSYQMFDFLWIELQSKYVGKQYIDNSASEKRMLSPYFINDLYIFSQLNNRYNKSIDISVSLQNILNHKYSSNAWVYRYYEGGNEKILDGYFPQAGTHFLASLSLKF